MNFSATVDGNIKIPSFTVILSNGVEIGASDVEIADNPKEEYLSEQAGYQYLYVDGEFFGIVSEGKIRYEGNDTYLITEELKSALCKPREA